MSQPRSIAYEIYLDDLDYMGVVNHATWITILERTRTALFAAEFRELVMKGFHLVIANVTANYRKPGQFKDKLNVEVTLSVKGKTSLVAEHSVSNQNNENLMDASITLVCVDNNGKPVALPEDIESQIG